MLCSFSQAQDIRITTVSGPGTFTLARNVNWQDANRTWIFRSPIPSVHVWFTIINRNPTSAHTVTIFGHFSPDPVAADRANNLSRWFTADLNDALTGTAGCTIGISIPAAGQGICYASYRGAAQLGIRLTGAALQAGSPDTFDLFVTITPLQSSSVVGSWGAGMPCTSSQMNVECMPVMIGAIPTTGSAVPLRLAAINSSPSDAESNGAVSPRLPTYGQQMLFNGTTWDRSRGNVDLGAMAADPLAWQTSRGPVVSYIVNNTLTNPAAAVDILNLQGSASRTYVHSLTFAATGAVQFNIVFTSAAGATCTALTVRSLQVNETPGSSVSANHTCTTDPTTLAIIDVVAFTASGGNYTLYLPATLNATGRGISVQTTAAVTGTISVTAKMYNGG